MTSFVSFHITDRDGSDLVVQTGSTPTVCAFIQTDGQGTWVLPHQVPAVCRALYEAAGLDVPDLPGIPDPELVEALATAINDAYGEIQIGQSIGHVIARGLLARGWGRTS